MFLSYIYHYSLLKKRLIPRVFYHAQDNLFSSGKYVHVLGVIISNMGGGGNETDSVSKTFQRSIWIVFSN